MAKYIIEIPDEVPVSDELVPFDMCRPSWYLEAYEKGKADTEDEVWNFARAINYMGYDDFVSCFGGKTEEVVYELSYSEVKINYEAWKRTKEIRVGDEIVEKDFKWEGVVVDIDDYGELTIMDRHGISCGGYKPKGFEKTNRHSLRLPNC